MIREYVESDLLAAFDGNPAAGCFEEIILAYPGIMASTVYRLAHELYTLKVPVIPRLMTEFAHSETGIGGNTFITASVPPNTRVSIKNPEMEYRTTDKKIIKEEIKQSDEWFYMI